jgi:hypothetical protein
MTDLPQHAAQIALLRNLQDPKFAFADLYAVNWFTPYLLGYTIIYLLAPVVGIVSACKLTVSISLIALPLCTSLLMTETGTDIYWAILVIPVMYGFSYYWGLLNFIVAAPLGILFLWMVIRNSRKHCNKNLLLTALLLNLLFFCHALICAFFGAISLLYSLFEQTSRKQIVRNAAALLSVIPLAFWWLKTTTLSEPVAHRPTVWDLGFFNTVDPYYKSLAAWATTPDHPGWGRISGFVPRMLGVEPRAEYLLIAAALFGIPVLAGARLSKEIKLWIPLLVCITVLLFAPNNILGTAFVFQRFTVFALPFFLILAQAPQTSPPYARVLRFATPGIVLVWIAAVSLRVEAYDYSARGFKELMERMEPGQRVLSLDYDRDDASVIAPVFAHYAAWYSAEKGGVVDPSNAFWFVELVRYRRDKIPKARVSDFEWHPGNFSWSRYDGAAYRYFIVRNGAEAGAYIFRDAACPVRLKYSSNVWWLYERDPSCTANTSLAAGSRATATHSFQNNPLSR